MLSLPAGGTGKKIDPAKLFGEDKYEKYASEIAADGTLDGERLTVEERKEGVKAYRKGKIDFEKFVNKVLKIKEEVSAPATGQARLTGSTFMPRALPQAEDLKPAPDDEDIPEGLDDLLNNLRTEQDELQAKLDALIEEVRKDDDVDGLDARLDDLLDNIRTMNEIEEQQAEVQRKKDEQKAREKKENRREKVKNFLVKPITKALAPVNNLFQKIIDGLFKLIFAKALIKLIDWFTDPKNKEKIDAIGRFIKDFWPAIVAGFLIFGTGLGGFAKTLLGTAGRIIGGLLRLSIKLAKITTKLALKAGKGLLKIAKGNPITTALVGGAVLAGTGAFIASQQNENRREGLDAADDASVVTPKEAREEGKTPGGSQLMQESILQRGMAFSGGGLAPKGTDVVPTMLTPGAGLASKGTDVVPAMLTPGARLASKGTDVVPTMLTPGAGLASKGTDVVPAMLTPGEFIMSKGAVDTFGTDFMESINSMGGGSNKPKKIDGTTYAAEGGSIEVKGTGNTVEGTLKMKDAAGKQVGKTYGVISGTYAGMNVPQSARATTRNAPMPDGSYKLVGFEKHGPYPGLPGIGNWSAFVNNSSGSIGSRSGLMLHSDIGSNGTLGCIGVELGGTAGTTAEKEFLETYQQINPQTIKVALGGGGGDASEVSSVNRTPSPDNSEKAAALQPAQSATPRVSPNALTPSSQTGSQGITPVPIPLGGGQQQAPTAQSSDVPQLGSVDPTNVSLLVMQSMYNLGGV
jgi:hypothetical protein